MEVTVYSVNVCHQTYWLLPLPVLASHCRTQSHPVGILCGATECRSLSAHWSLMLYVLCSLPAQLTSCSAAVSHGKGCVVPHTQITSVDLWGWAFLPVQEMQEHLERHCQSGGTERPLGLWCWGCAGSTEHRQVKDTHRGCAWLCTSSWWGITVLVTPKDRQHGSSWHPDLIWDTHEQVYCRCSLHKEELW